MACRAEHTCDATPALASVSRGSAVVGSCCDAAITSAGSLADLPDRRLLAAIAAGSRIALGQLHGEYFSRLVKFFTHLIPSAAPELVDDLIADTLFDVWRTSSTFASDSSVHVAIMRLAWTHGSKHLANSGAGTSIQEPPPRTRARQTRLAVRSEAEQLTAEVFASLPPMGRVVIHLVYSGHSRQEVADILSTPCESVDAYLSRWMSARAGVWSQVTRS
jgi:DNA-directed RNA polymerase specialized sigma24 family protein